MLIKLKEMIMNSKYTEPRYYLQPGLLPFDVSKCILFLNFILGVSSLCNFLSNLPHGLESLLLKDVGITGKGLGIISNFMFTCSKESKPSSHRFGE